MRSDHGSVLRRGYSSREMTLISVDLPEPLGPRITACSPCAMERVTPSSTTRSPRCTVTFWKSMRGTSDIDLILYPSPPEDTPAVRGEIELPDHLVRGVSAS